MGIPYALHSLERKTFRILDGPVVAPDPRDDWTRFAAPHSDQGRRLSGDLVRQESGSRSRQGHAGILHGLKHDGVNPIGGLRSRRDGARLRRIGQVVEPGSRHLRSTGVVYAGEEHRVHGETHDVRALMLDLLSEGRLARCCRSAVWSSCSCSLRRETTASSTRVRRRRARAEPAPR